jgi:acetyl esterase/lipase
MAILLQNVQKQKMKQLIKSTYVLIVILLISSCTENASDIGESSISKIDTVLLNVKYGNHPRQIMDIHLPADRDSSTPVIMIIHGGAWIEGKKEDMNPFVNIIKRKWKNCAIANMNYRYASLKESIHHDQMMNDIHSAFIQLKEKKEQLGISSKYAICGASAGGHLAMIYAYTRNSEIKCIGNIFGPSNIRDWDWYASFNVFLGSKVGDILTEYVGKSWDTTAYATVSPITYIQSKTPPTITFHGSLDPIVPMYQSQYLHGILTASGVPNAFHQYLAYHGFDNAQSDDVAKKMVTFMKSHIQ